MPRFLAVYTINSEDLASFRRLSKAEQDAVDAKGIAQWTAWEERHAAVILDRGGMVGKTTRVTKQGIAEAKNPLFAVILWWKLKVLSRNLHFCCATVRSERIIE